MMVRHYLPIALVWAVTLFRPFPLQAQETVNAPVTREITRVHGDLYRVQDGQEYTVFVLTPEGIILADPLGRQSALWLRDELEARFQQPVRFVLHTSHHYARAAGSSVFNDTAAIVGQASFDEEMRKAQDEFPEKYGFSLRTRSSFARTRLITLGGQSVEMIHVPAPRTPEMAVVRFPAERVVFASRLPGIGEVPFSFAKSGASDVFAWMETLRPLEFDSLLVGDGRTVSRAQFDELWRYLSALRAAVVAGVRDARTLEEIQARATLEPFRTSPHYPGRAAQISELYAAQQSSVLMVSAGWAGSYARLSSAFCASRTSCSGGGASPAVRFALSLAGGRGLNFQGEATFSGQTWSARTSPSVDEEMATRRSRGTFLFRWSPRPSRFAYALAAGPSVTLDDVKGLNRVKGALLPTGGYHAVEQHKVRAGMTVGADLERTLRGGLVIRLPLRVTWMVPGASDGLTESRLDVQAGIDVTFRLLHRVWFR